MIRLSKNTFTDLAIRMIGFGLLVGLVFPPFVVLMGVSKSIAYSLWFILACILAGVIVGFVNIVLSRVTVRNRLKILTGKMQEVKRQIVLISESGDIKECDPEQCYIPVDSNDEFGQSTQAFNELIESFSSSLRTLDEIKNYTEVFSSQLDLLALSNIALGLAIQSSAAKAGAIFLEQDGEIRLLTAFGIKEAPALVDDQNILEAFSKGHPRSISHPDGIVVESTLLQFHPSEILIEPVKFKSIPIAVVLLAKDQPFETDFRKQLSLFSLSLAIALHNAVEHEQLQKLAALDPLTEVFNRRFGLIRLREEYTRAVRKDLPLGVLMFDIDHFKKVNDVYGHVAGDRVLKSVTKQIRQCMREGDIAIRYGGEEFMLVLPGASKADSFKIAERIRHIIKDNKTTYGDNDIYITISIGCDSYPETAIDGEQELIVNADEALYRAKDSGRDKVMIH